MDPKFSLSGWLWLALASALAAMAVFAFGLSRTGFQKAFRASSRAVRRAPVRLINTLDP